ncbi:MAG TPA: UPF0182 family protein [Oscillospiraceae bacterium]|nr:UPF0182 family protein [Oscillospiraceae bacterium]
MKRIFPLLIIFVVLMLAWLAAGSYLDWLWFSHLGFASVYQTVLTSSWAVGLGSFLFFAIFLFCNLLYVQKSILGMPNLVLRHLLMNTRFGDLLTPQRLRSVFLGLALPLAWLTTVPFRNAWLTVRLFTAGANTGVTEPIFNADVGFYLFRLPLWELIYQYLLLIFIVTLLVCGVLYLFIRPPQQLGLRTLFATRGQFHLSRLLAGTLLVRAGGYRLQMYRLVYAPDGVVFGAGYTDVHALLPAYWVMLLLAVVGAVILILNTKLKQSRLLTGSIVSIILASLVLNNLVPLAVQKFLVEPNEFVREEPYLQYNIDFTQQAYGLKKIEEREFPLNEALQYEELLANETTLDNIRLWDWRPLGQTFNQLQSLRQYYTFHDVDTDRYLINGEQRQVMLAAREMVTSQLAAPTWINMHLAYTHGYGAVASPVNEATGQRLPKLFLHDLPIKGESDLQVDVPQIYYGELTDNYIFTNTKTKEFDYPMGESNAVTSYDGEGGIPLGGPLRRLLFGLRFADYRILVSNELTAASRLHFKRNLAERLHELMPFLQYDEDPYLVVADGRLFWMIDAYTVSNRYPYAQPYSNINYIRNPVKVTVDAYHGTVHFYVFDADEPLLAAYSKIFPTAFTPAAEMPPALAEHVRYPETLFKLQSEVYATYHMDNSNVFYNKEDRWQVPQEKYGNEPIEVEPYYTILRLPAEAEAEFILMRPYTMYERDNMVAWLAARSDGEGYGQLVVYQFPKGELVYGPAQIEARIDQDTTISQQLALWNQQGSRVGRGNLLILPVNGTILYVEPIYLQAEQSELPELARVIVAYGDRVVMENTLEEALAAVFGLQLGDSEPDLPEKPPEPPETGGLPLPAASLETLIRQAAELYQEAEMALKAGSWAEYGRLQEELGRVLESLQEFSLQD